MPFATINPKINSWEQQSSFTYLHTIASTTITDDQDCIFLYYNSLVEWENMLDFMLNCTHSNRPCNS